MRNCRRRFSYTVVVPHADFFCTITIFRFIFPWRFQGWLLKTFIWKKFSFPPDTQDQPASSQYTQVDQIFGFLECIILIRLYRINRDRLPWQVMLCWLKGIELKELQGRVMKNYCPLIGSIGSKKDNISPKFNSLIDIVILYYMTSYLDWVNKVALSCF